MAGREKQTTDNTHTTHTTGTGTTTTPNKNQKKNTTRDNHSQRMRRIIGMIVTHAAAPARANNTAATSAPSSRCRQPPTASARLNILKHTRRMTGCMASYRKTGHVMDGKE